MAGGERHVKLVRKNDIFSEVRKNGKKWGCTMDRVRIGGGTL